MAENVGGFFASLKLQADEESFRRGVQGIKGVGSGLADLIKMGLGLAGLTMTMKGLFDAASKQGQLLMQATFINMSADAISNWSGAMKEAGGNADSFIGSLSDLNSKIIQMKFEGMDPGNKLFQDLGQLGLTPSSIIDMDSNQRAKAILGAASKMKNQELAMDIVKRLLGGEMGGLQLLNYSKVMNRLIDQILADASKRNLSSDSLRKGGEAGVAEVRKLQDEATNVMGALGSTIMKDLAPYLKKLTTWLEGHQSEIKDIIKGIGDLTAALLEFIGSAVIKSMVEFLAILSGHPEAAQKMADANLPGLSSLKAASDADVAKASPFWQGVAKATIQNPVFTMMESWAVGLYDRLGIHLDEMLAGKGLKINVNVTGLQPGQAATATVQQKP